MNKGLSVMTSPQLKRLANLIYVNIKIGTAQRQDVLQCRKYAFSRLKLLTVVICIFIYFFDKSVICILSFISFIFCHFITLIPVGESCYFLV